jgi:exopolysaccharide biosynthesis polyprenyl glycosylphosphotransferase
MTLTSSLDTNGTSVWRDSHPLFLPLAYKGRAHRPRRRVYYLSHRGALREPSSSRSKRVFDIIGAGAALLVLSPLLAAVAAAIKITSPGPVFFTQYRYGHRNRRFRIIKFRTMHVQMADETGITQTVGDDPRVTLLGRILRKTSIDELPQLINVVLGDMSLVGPRPHVPGMKAASVCYEDLVPYYFQRHNIRPGITGLAQVNGCRGSTALAAAAVSRVDYDLAYIEQWSLWLDVKIIWRTIRHEFFCGTGN